MTHLFKINVNIFYEMSGDQKVSLSKLLHNNFINGYHEMDCENGKFWWAWSVLTISTYFVPIFWSVFRILLGFSGLSWTKKISKKFLK